MNNYSNKLNKNNADLRLCIEKANNLPNVSISESAIWKTTRRIDQGIIPEKYLVSDTLYFNKNITEEEVDAIYNEIVKLKESWGESSDYYDFEIYFGGYFDAQGSKSLKCFVDKIEKNICIDLIDEDGTTRVRLFVKKQLSEDFKNYTEDGSYPVLENKDFDFIGWNPNMNEITFEFPVYSLETCIIKDLFSYNQLDDSESLELYSGKLYINDLLSKEDIYSFYEENIPLSDGGVVMIARYFEGYSNYDMGLMPFDESNFGIVIMGSLCDEYYNNVGLSVKILYTTTNDHPMLSDEVVEDYDGFIGWNPNLKNFDLEDVYLLIGNSNVNKIISTEPFEEEYNYPLEGEYLGTTIKASSNIDMITFLENKEIPVSIIIPENEVGPLVEVDALPHELTQNTIYEFKEKIGDIGEIRDIYIKFPTDWNDETFSANFNNLVTLREYLYYKKIGKNSDVFVYYMTADELPTLVDGQYAFKDNLSNEMITISEVDDSDEKIVILVGENSYPYILKNMEWVDLYSYINNLTGYELQNKGWVTHVDQTYDEGIYFMRYTGPRPILWLLSYSRGVDYSEVADTRWNAVHAYRGDHEWVKYISCHDVVISSDIQTVDGDTIVVDEQTGRSYSTKNARSNKYSFFTLKKVAEDCYELYYFDYWSAFEKEGPVGESPGMVKCDSEAYDIVIYWRNSVGTTEIKNLCILGDQYGPDYTKIYTRTGSNWRKETNLDQYDVGPYYIRENGQYNISNYKSVHVNIEPTIPDNYVHIEPGTTIEINGNSSDWDVRWADKANVQVGNMSIFKLSTRTVEPSTDSLWIDQKDYYYTTYYIDIVNKIENSFYSFSHLYKDLPKISNINDYLIVDDYIYMLGSDYIKWYNIKTGEWNDGVTTVSGFKFCNVFVDGIIYSFGGSSGYVQKFNTITKEYTTSTSNGELPKIDRGHAVNANGTVYIAEKGKSYLYKYDITNQTYEEVCAIPETYNDTSHKIIAIDGSVYIFISNQIYKYDQNSNMLESLITYQTSSSNTTGVCKYKNYILISLANGSIIVYDYIANSIVEEGLSGLTGEKWIGNDEDLFYLKRSYSGYVTLHTLKNIETGYFPANTIVIYNKESGVPFNLKTVTDQVNIKLNIEHIYLGQGDSTPAQIIGYKIYDGSEWKMYN